MNSQIITQKTALKVKTGLKAGDHCRNRFQEHLRDPYNNDRIKKFVECCQDDNKCLR